MKHLIIPDREIQKVKFIQVYVTMNGRKEPFLRHYDFWGGYHSTLLANFLTEFGINFQSVRLADDTFCIKPEEEGIYRLCGAGRMQYTRGLHTFWGLSSDYKLAPDKEHFEELQKKEPRFRFRIDVSKRD